MVRDAGDRQHYHRYLEAAYCYICERQSKASGRILYSRVVRRAGLPAGVKQRPYAAGLSLFDILGRRAESGAA